MITSPESAIHATKLAPQDILSQPEPVALRRLTKLVEYLFRVPVAYMALPDHSAVGSGSGSAPECGKFLKTYPSTYVFTAPKAMTGVAPGLRPDSGVGDIRFAASAPIRTSAGLELGTLVIADPQPRPDFSERDLQALATLAEVVAGKMELRMVASHAVESDLALRETEERFRAMANAAPVLMIYSGADGGCAFVNRTWLEFTGRSMEESLGEGWAGDVHPEDSRRVHEAYWRAFQARQPFASEWRMRRHDGRYRWMLGRDTPRFQEDGTFAGFVGALVDIEDQRGRHPE